ncbi:hypothetical protein V1264_024219 [Littorina saxatilis]|uniref:Uncharacterized protein n=1 Tax=Littorina saxatilis TaxID=31220 RepID=A0AAN9G009_9CAEN
MEDSGTWVWRTGGGERKEVDFIIRRSSKPHNVTGVVPDNERNNTSSYDEHSDAKEDDGNTIVLVSSCLGGVAIVSIAVVIFVVIRKRTLRATRRQSSPVANEEDGHPLPGDCHAYTKTRRVSSHFYDEVKYET